MKIAPNQMVPAQVSEQRRISPEQEAQLRKVARQFESIFVNQMVGAMRNTVAKGGLIPESQGERVYRNMLDAEYAEKISNSDQIGISELVYQHLLKTASGQ